jgi:hypothetical protein
MVKDGRSLVRREAMKKLIILNQQTALWASLSEQVIGRL